MPLVKALCDGSKVKTQKTWQRSCLVGSYVKYALVYTCKNICLGFDAAFYKTIGYAYCP